MNSRATYTAYTFDFWILQLTEVNHIVMCRIADYGVHIRSLNLTTYWGESYCHVHRLRRTHSISESYNFLWRIILSCADSILEMESVPFPLNFQPFLNLYHWIEFVLPILKIPLSQYHVCPDILWEVLKNTFPCTINPYFPYNYFLSSSIRILSFESHTWRDMT